MESSVLEEKHRVVTSHVLNNIYIYNITGDMDRCSEAVSNSLASLSAWSALNESNSIVYNVFNTSDASDTSTVDTTGVTGVDLSQSQSQVCKATLKDTSREHTADLSLNSTLYAQETDATMTQMSMYSTAVATYNAEYLANKTAHLQETALAIVQNVSLTDVNLYIDTSLRSMREVMDISIVCLSIANSTDLIAMNITASCPYDTSLSELYTHYTALVMVFMESYVALAAESFDDLKAQYDTVVGVGRAFYSSISGASGVMRAVAEFIPGINLCGRSNPDWCSFSSVSIPSSV